MAFAPSADHGSFGRRGGDHLRRGIDLAIGIVAGVVLSPLALVVSGFVRWRLGRPVFFRQRRSGMNGREFTIVKFRTMRPEAFPGEPDASRDTKLGRFLRSSSMDELPQLWNVVRGDMSLIGPRPTLPEQVRHYGRRLRGRLAVRPGSSGWAQVNGRNSISWPERIELDLWYLANRSFMLDLRIVGRTIRRLLVPHGITAEGGVNPGFPAPPPDGPREAFGGGS
jgi:lipopolysaccharide/colanic/teichoic acid biosynthesis glycosyltransferase